MKFNDSDFVYFALLSGGVIVCS